MISERTGSRIGLGLLALAMGWAILAVGRREQRERDPERIPVRVAHTFLTREAREAFAAANAAFERRQAARGRRVEVAMIEVPERVYSQWLRTQFVGGTAPEIVLCDRLNLPEGEFLSRNLVPLGSVIAEPNPENAGTPLEGQRWRDTFLDGMEQSGFSFLLAEHYGVCVAASTNRILINTTLRDAVLASPAGRALAEELGPGRTPRTFDQFLALCEAAGAYPLPGGKRLTPLASSREVARALFDDVMGGATQSLLVEWSEMRDLRTLYWHLGNQVLEGRADWSHAAFREGLELKRELGRHFTPGFTQIQREDAAFQFTQGAALMILAGTRDAVTYRSLAEGRFEVGSFRLPQPPAGHPRFGRLRFGELSDMGVNALFGTLCLVSTHPPERRRVALEYLQYLTSWEGNTLFSQKAGWLPVIADAPIPAEVEAFRPVMGGYGRGPLFSLGTVEDMRRLVETQWHVLMSPTGGVEAFLAATVPPLREAVPETGRKWSRGGLNGLRRQDSLLAASIWLAEAGEGEAAAEAARRYEMLTDSALWNWADVLSHRVRQDAALAARRR